MPSRDTHVVVNYVFTSPNATKCKVLRSKFNTKRAFEMHQLPMQFQIFNSWEGLFGCIMGLACERCKMNFYFKKPSFALF